MRRIEVRGIDILRPQGYGPGVGGARARKVRLDDERAAPRAAGAARPVARTPTGHGDGRALAARQLARLRSRTAAAPLPVGQARLTVGPSNDPLEREADEVARAVTGATGFVRRSGPHAAEGAAPALAGGDMRAGGSLTSHAEAVILQHRGAGRPLPAGLRRQMEGSFGADFTGVRIHTDERAGAVSRSMGARAFTSGRDIYFGEGSFDPSQASGRHLLAHELTHVVQQGGGARRTTIQRDIGFEYEDNRVRTYEVLDRADLGFATNKEAQDLVFKPSEAGKRRRLPKGAALLKHPGKLFEVQADDQGDNSDIEVVTPHFPATDKGRARLRTALLAIDDFNEDVKASPLSEAATTESVKGNLKLANKKSFLYGFLGDLSGGLKTSPQVTFGAGLEDVTKVVKHLHGKDAESAKAARRRGAGRRMVRGTDPLTGNTPKPALGEGHYLVDGRRLAAEALDTYRIHNATAPAEATGAAVKGLLTLIYAYAEAGPDKSPFLKTKTPLMAKTNYATLWKTLPKPAQSHLKQASALGGGRTRFEDLVALATGYDGNRLTRPLFETRVRLVDEVPDMNEAEWYKNLTMGDWVRAMTKGVDKLTTKKFPNLPKGKKVEGYGVLGSKMDKDPGTGDKLPVFELRSASAMMTFDKLESWSLKMFDYFRKLNEGAAKPRIGTPTPGI